VLDVDAGRALAGIKGHMLAKISLVDREGEVVHEETYDPHKDVKRQAHWFGWRTARPRMLSPDSKAAKVASLLSQSDADGKTFAIDEKQALNAYVTPLCVTGLGNGNILYSLGAWRVLKVKIPPDRMARVTDLKAKMVLVRSAPAHKK
jgi:hypothetical protein